MSTCKTLQLIVLFVIGSDQLQTEVYLNWTTQHVWSISSSTSTDTVQKRIKFISKLLWVEIHIVLELVEWLQYKNGTLSTISGHVRLQQGRPGKQIPEPIQLNFIKLFMFFNYWNELFLSNCLWSIHWASSLVNTTTCHEIFIHLLAFISGKTSYAASDASLIGFPNLFGKNI